jgi:hypothetical protein
MKTIATVAAFLLMVLSACSPDAPKLSVVRAAHWIEVVCGAPLSSMPEVLRGAEKISRMPHGVNHYVDGLVRVSAADLGILRHSLDRDPHDSSSRAGILPTDPADGVPLHELCDIDLDARTVHIEYWN